MIKEDKFWLLPKTLPDIVSVGEAIAAIVIELLYYCANHRTEISNCL
jgi:hypothetical protein